MRIVLWIARALEPTFQKLCGQDGVLTGKYIESDADLGFFANVPLENVTREEALQRAKYHGGDIYGVVPLRSGSWAIRVLAGQYESAARQISQTTT